MSVFSPVFASYHRDMDRVLERYFKRLHEHFGAQSWWPARSRFEVIVGAILTQNTAWTNVAKAIEQLRAAGKLSVDGIRELPVEELGRLIRSSGYWRQKSRKLKNFITFLDDQYDGSLSRMFRQPTASLREQLLSIPGIGPETADSILLYAGGHAAFVIDAYTRRILGRHDLLEIVPRGSGGAAKDRATEPSYEDLRTWFEAELPRDAALYNEFHALIVQTGKTYCLKQEARCEQCPLAEFLPAVTGKSPADRPPAAAGSRQHSRKQDYVQKRNTNTAAKDNVGRAEPNPNA